MPQAVNITLADAQGTPVTHTFVPIGTDGDGVLWFEDQSQSTAIGFWRISIQRKAPSVSQLQAGSSSKDRVYRYRVALHLPVLETLSNNTVSGIIPAPTLAYVERGSLEYISPERSALIDRKNIAKMLPLLGQIAQIVSMIENNSQLS